MASFVRQFNKRAGHWYVYYSESYWIPGVGPRARRKLIGREDPETGYIVPTKKRGTKKDEENPEPEKDPLKGDIQAALKRIENMEQALQEQHRALQAYQARTEILLKQVQEVKEYFTTVEESLDG